MLSPLVQKQLRIFISVVHAVPLFCVNLQGWAFCSINSSDTNVCCIIYTNVYSMILNQVQYKRNDGHKHRQNCIIENVDESKLSGYYREETQEKERRERERERIIRNQHTPTDNRD